MNELFLPTLHLTESASFIIVLVYSLLPNDLTLQNLITILPNIIKYSKQSYIGTFMHRKQSHRYFICLMWLAMLPPSSERAVQFVFCSYYLITSLITYCLYILPVWCRGGEVQFDCISTWALTFYNNLHFFLAWIRLNPSYNPA